MPLTLQYPVTDINALENQAILLFEPFPHGLWKFQMPQGPMLIGDWAVGVKGEILKLAIDTASPVTWIAASNSSFSSSEFARLKKTYTTKFSLSKKNEGYGRTQLSTPHGVLLGWLKSDMFASDGRKYRLKYLEADRTPRSIDLKRHLWNTRIRRSPRIGRYCSFSRQY